MSANDNVIPIHAWMQWSAAEELNSEVNTLVEQYILCHPHISIGDVRLRYRRTSDQGYEISVGHVEEGEEPSDGRCGAGQLEPCPACLEPTNPRGMWGHACSWACARDFYD